ncbi:hypothetical protein [Neochlamydia sp. S13]|uniref:hypothetical protein n=1 Tax=Neochlamydia sp. S13 TaxID=1353976 RepID=UPI0005A6B557|nr:hypothetical protein [Neochlamydia sp. S13]BBI17374.1 hypothetical protein NCS13_1_1179 [Neochlamydia sp. S13]
MIVPSSVIRDKNSEDAEVIEYIYNRLPKNGTFSKTDIKVSRVIYDWAKGAEHPTSKPLNKYCEITRKITLKRQTASKIGEGFQAFFLTFLNMAQNKYNLDEAHVAYAKTAIEEILSDEHLEDNQNSRELKSLYVNCKTIVVYQSLETEEHSFGPLFADGQGIAYTCTAAVVAHRITPLALSVIATVLQASKSSCTLF